MYTISPFYIELIVHQNIQSCIYSKLSITYDDFCFWIVFVFSSTEEQLDYWAPGSVLHRPLRDSFWNE